MKYTEIVEGKAVLERVRLHLLQREYPNFDVKFDAIWCIDCSIGALKFEYKNKRYMENYNV